MALGAFSVWIIFFMLYIFKDYGKSTKISSLFR